LKRIDRESKLLLDMAASGQLPGYPSREESGSFYTDAAPSADLTEYDSRELDLLEAQLKALWAREPDMQACIPLILAAAEKSRGQEGHALPPTELYNYAM